MNAFMKFTLVASMCAMAPSAVAGLHHPDYDATNYVMKGQPSSVFANRRAATVDRLNSRIYSDGRRLSKSVKPEEVYGPASLMGDLDAPDGRSWFYTAKLTYDTIPPDYEAGIWFTELILREYDFTIFDENMEPIGHVYDKMRYEEDEVRVPYIDLAPVVTRNFFNTDDYYEVVVGVATNPGIGRVREHSFVYSLNKDNKDADGFDQPVAHMYSFIGDVLTLSDKTGEERYLITTSSEEYSNYQVSEDDADYTGDPAESPFWQSLISQKMTVNVFANAVNDTDGPVKVGSKVIPLTQLQGDQMSAPIVLTTAYEGKPYVVFAQYKDSFYNPYASPWDEDVSMRENNALVVEIYSQGAANEPLELFQTTEIKFSKDATVDRLLASYYSIGNLRFRNDVDFNPEHYNNKSGKAYLTVTKENYIAGSDDSYINSYYIYKDTGVRYKTIITDTQGAMSLSDVEGHEPQMVFVTYTSGYEFHFVNMLSVKDVLTLSNNYNMGDDQEPEALLANLDRTPAGDSYHYVFELRVPTVDEDENDNIRAIWINADGSFDRIDEVNMGPNVMYAKLYLKAPVLKPGVYTATDNMAYMCLIKRGLGGSAMQEELLVAEAKCVDAPSGRTLLECKPNDYGVLSSVMPLFSNDMPRLWVVYSDAKADMLTLEMYKLPLEETEDPEIPEDPDDSITEIGAENAADARIYDLRGVCVGTSANALPKGVYVVKSAGEANKIIR